MDVAAWLQDLGLEHYEPTFRDNGIVAEMQGMLRTAQPLRLLGAECRRDCSARPGQPSFRRLIDRPAPWRCDRRAPSRPRRGNVPLMVARGFSSLSFLILFRLGAPERSREPRWSRDADRAEPHAVAAPPAIADHHRVLGL